MQQDFALVTPLMVIPAVFFLQYKDIIENCGCINLQDAHCEKFIILFPSFACDCLSGLGFICVLLTQSSTSSILLGF
jgi:hypothetical protein